MEAIVPLDPSEREPSPSTFKVVDTSDVEREPQQALVDEQIIMTVNGKTMEGPWKFITISMFILAKFILS